MERQRAVGRSARLPLFPRMHLLPNGHVFYNANGQSFNPFGQSYDEALWNVAASLRPGHEELEATSASRG